MSNMPKITIITGLVLIAAGVVGFAAAGFDGKAVTALIPAAFGLLIGISGIVARRESARKHAMHVAVIVGLIGFLAAAGRIFGSLTKGSIEWRLSTIMLLVMAVTCLVFVIRCIQSFIAARRDRQS